MKGGSIKPQSNLGSVIKIKGFSIVAILLGTLPISLDQSYLGHSSVCKLMSGFSFFLSRISFLETRLSLAPEEAELKERIPNEWIF
jgi:hypothetical protein